MGKPTYWEHRIKCLSCSLHFIVLSDYEDWPNEETAHVTDRKPTCPECWGGGLMHFDPQQMEGFIFERVPGSAILDRQERTIGGS